MIAAFRVRGGALSLLVLACAGLLSGSCSSGPLSVGDNRLPIPGAGGADDAGSTPDSSMLEPNATNLLPLLAKCERVSSGLLAPRSGQLADVAVCGLGNAVFWKSQLAVDCDGKSTASCNSTNDPQFNGDTVGKDSAGDSLDATVVPYVEVPAADSVFDYRVAGLSMGSVVAVIYQGRLAYGVIGHEQTAGQIGAGSYALANLLGIDPNPVTGGLEDEDVYYVAFTGPGNVVSALDDSIALASLGKTAVTALLVAGQ